MEDDAGTLGMAALSLRLLVLACLGFSGWLLLRRTRSRSASASSLERRNGAWFSPVDGEPVRRPSFADVVDGRPPCVGLFGDGESISFFIYLFTDEIKQTPMNVSKLYRAITLF